MSYYKSLLFTYRQQQRRSGITSHDGVQCTCQRRCQRQRRVTEDFVGGREAPAEHCSRYLTAGDQQHSVRTAADTIACSTTSSSHGVKSADGQIASVLQSEQSRFDREVEGRLCDWFTAARYDDNLLTAVSCQRRCRQRRHRVQHVNTSTSVHVSRTRARRRVVSRWLTVRRRCSVVVDRRRTADVTSGDNVTMTSATDSESTSSSLDRAFVADRRNDDAYSITKWQPDLSPIAGTPPIVPRRPTAAERTRVADGKTVGQSTTSHYIASPVTAPMTAYDMVGRVVVVLLNGNYTTLI